MNAGRRRFRPMNVLISFLSPFSPYASSVARSISSREKRSPVAKRLLITAMVACAWQQRCLHDPALLLRRTKNPLRRTACGKLARITHEPIVEPILKPVYMIKGGRLPTNLSRQFSNQGWAWSSSRLPLCASGGVVFDRWYRFMSILYAFSFAS
jgi:hypothetical protein